jgi:ketosteroid isomerase-like protein
MAGIVAGCATAPAGRAQLAAATLQAQRAEVMQTERAFAQSMADRDYAAFGSFIADDAVFFDGPNALHGKAAVTAAWKSLFDGKAAPFAWAPDQVEVLGSGALALSTGPVTDPAGRTIARFNSIWRRESSGAWRVIFDRGCDVCTACAEKR